MNGKGGGPAFPVPVEGFQDFALHPARGMSLRDWFAATIDIPIAVVMDGLEKNGFPDSHTVGEVAAYRAKLRYCEADAMLQVRELEATNPEGS